MSANSMLFTQAKKDGLHDHHLIMQSRGKNEDNNIQEITFYFFRFAGPNLSNRISSIMDHRGKLASQHKINRARLEENIFKRMTKR